MLPMPYVMLVYVVDVVVAVVEVEVIVLTART